MFMILQLEDLDYTAIKLLLQLIFVLNIDVLNKKYG